ncbi:sodium/hydrogen exchanger 8-like [Liolophura sinensis]|uniref:sodium/hydrogen exchanger 8-like n=1 Tax=Liolophura sinensis TaxID=3198878 RepID=UPI00315875BE
MSASRLVLQCSLLVLLHGVYVEGYSDPSLPLDRAKRSPQSAAPLAAPTTASPTTPSATVTRPPNISAVNETLINITSTEAPTTTEAAGDNLPKDGAAAEEHHSSMTIFFILLVVAICILLVHLLIQTRFHYLPESVAIVLLGALIGLILKFTKFGNWRNEEAFSPTVFFLILLPPIIFESGYNLHKGNFFQNIGSILVFAIFGTVISAMVIGGGVYLLGKAQVATELDVVESFAFGSLISAVDPVATLAIFQAIEVDPILYMLVFGESVLNDAVSIVLTKTMLEFNTVVTTSAAAAVFQAIGIFCLMFFASAAIGAACGLISAIVLKIVDLRKTPSLEFGMMLIFSYLPYGLAEGIQLSGIMAILFCGIVMSHYTHLNLSPVTQITVQQTFRTIAFIAETCVFAYLGLAIFSFKHIVRPPFVIWSIALCLIGRAVNIFPLSFILNYFREHKITRKMQFIMWFSGLRGAIAFAISLHLEFEDKKRHILLTTTLIIVLFTLLFLGGSTMPLLKFLKAEKKTKKRKRREKMEVSLSKTKEMGDALDSEHLSELTEEEYEVNFVKPHLKGFLKIDAKYLIPFFTRRFTQQEVREGRNQINHLTNKWYKDVRAAPSESENEEEEEENEEETRMMMHN